MTEYTNAELEARFQAEGLSRATLYPWWYRTIRALGFDVKPPVIASPVVQVVCMWANLAVLAGLVIAVTLWLDQRMKPVWIVSAVFFTVNPLLTWLYYRSLRRRIGL